MNEDRMEFADSYYHDSITPPRMREITVKVTMLVSTYEEDAIVVATGCGPEMEEAAALVFADNGIDVVVRRLEVTR